MTEDERNDNITTIIELADEAASQDVTVTLSSRLAKVLSGVLKSRERAYSDLNLMRRECAKMRKRNVRLRSEVRTLRALIDDWDHITEELIEEELELMDKEKDKEKLIEKYLVPSS